LPRLLQVDRHALCGSLYEEVPNQWWRIRVGEKAPAWQNSNLNIILSALFLVSWGLQTWAGWVRFSASQEEHPQVADVFGPIRVRL
jgi:hypothetical protein